MVGGTADIRDGFIDSSVASGLTRGADLVVVQRVLWMVDYMAVG